jgi:hypothetical protein
VLGITNTRRPTGKEGSGYYDERTPGLLTQIKMLFAREIANLCRDTTALGARFGLTTFLSCLIGTIFFKVGEEPRDNQIGLQSQFGALVMIQLVRRPE